MDASTQVEDYRGRWSVLTFSTLAFTLMFGVWMMLGVLNVTIRKSMGFSESQMEWLLAAAIFAGALPRLSFGILADRFGGRKIYLFLLLFCAIPCYLLTKATNYPQMLACVLLFGLAGNSFTAGISWNSAWFPPYLKGLALGVVGAGNVGASATKLLVILIPAILLFDPVRYGLSGIVPGGWRFIPFLYAILLVLMAVAIFLFTPKVDKLPAKGRTVAELLTPLKHVRVWRFSLYYVVVFGSYVALSSWLPKFYQDTYKLSLHDAALLTALFIFPASLLRPVGGWLSDKYGPRVVTYSVFFVMILALTALCIPSGRYFGLAYDPGPGLFTTLMVVVGSGMGIGKASVYKYVPDYFPNDVGAVGGLVGALGALGGFFMPPLFGYLGRTTGSPRTAFAAILVLTLISLAWLHASVLQLKADKRRAAEGRLIVEGSPS